MPGHPDILGLCYILSTKGTLSLGLHYVGKVQLILQKALVWL